MAKVSIIMPSYNVADFIEECIESVVTQTLKDIEIICVDAYSSDGTAQIIEDYAANDPRIRIIYSQVKSYGAQVNIGIKEAKGEYIGIVETDDYIEPDMYEILYKEARYKKAQVVKSEYYYVYEKSDGTRYEEYKRYIPDHIRAIPFSPEMEPAIHKWDSYIWDGIYKRSFLINNSIAFRETPGASYQDIGFKHRVLNRADSILFMKTPLYHYRVIREGSSSVSAYCFRNACDEYQALYDDIKPCFRGGLCAGMTMAILREFKKLIQFEEYKPGYKSWYESIKWLKGVVRDNYSDMMFSRVFLTDAEKEEIDRFLDDTDVYIFELYDKLHRLISWFEDFRVFVTGRQLVIAGCNISTKYIRDFLMRNGLMPVAVLDIEEETWGKSFGPYTILRPDKVISEYTDAIFIMTDENYIDIAMDKCVFKGIYANIPEIMAEFQEIIRRAE